jgi:hypothetical protein
LYVYAGIPIRAGIRLARFEANGVVDQLVVAAIATTTYRLREQRVVGHVHHGVALDQYVADPAVQINPAAVPCRAGDLTTGVVNEVVRDCVPALVTGGVVGVNGATIVAVCSDIFEELLVIVSLMPCQPMP